MIKFFETFLNIIRGVWEGFWGLVFGKQLEGGGVSQDLP